MKVSVVIPALDEAEHIEAAVRSALAEAAESALTRSTELEVIVCDGGSRDATGPLARRAGARVLDAPRGRSRQLARGVEASSGEVLLFLHADTRLPAGWSRAVATALADPSVVGGAFAFGFDERSPALRFIEFGARLRHWLFALPYGDQGLFVRRRELAAVGGVPQVPLLEDLDLVVALKRRGRLARLPAVARTSARRYRAGGPLRTMLRHWAIGALWALGVPRERIAGWMRR